MLKRHMLYRLSYEINFFIAGAKVGLFLINPNPNPIYLWWKSPELSMHREPNAGRIRAGADNSVLTMGREHNVVP